MYDVIVIGAGPAGLQAALTLGRMHRSTLVLDSGEYRNGPVSHMHNVVANDGTPPAEFRATAREQLAAYGDVELRNAAATRITGERDDFTVELAGGASERARRVVLATGVADDLPPVPGLDELWGRGAYNCPFCDGHEFSGARIGILGAAERTEHLIGLLGRIASEIVVFPLDGAADQDVASRLAGAGASVHSAKVDGVGQTDAGIAVRTADGEITVGGLFVAAGSVHQRAPFAEQLGLRMLPSGAIEVDEFGCTSLPGISAAGDLAHRAALPGIMASVVMAAAAGQLAAVGVVRELMPAQ
ncbi:NAD(P)/FAD-dependent oxidoreductase [Microbacterium sp. M28]|uniref:NAD(P)/FAD-dependent oxidoreductase n=1 Tax=Microbacterium sp. M28 TaxID=2962064 RepID=UPI0021F4BA3D|nr:NAD(P)/FAD-dependent oxidoreductase [Microbacterium sp. M28]UYO96436.1 NAD(P)/FAD-dependent oxidoreductase [Microbacterium sp. M28]